MTGWKSMSNQKTKILHVLKSSVYAGAEHVAVSICKSLQEQFAFAYASVDGEIAPYVKGSGISFYPMSAFSIREVTKVLELYQPDIIHAHDFSAFVVCALVKKKSRLIAHLHHNPPWIQNWNYKAAVCRLLLERADRILAVSNAILEESVFFHKHHTKVLVVQNPVDTMRIRKMAQESNSVSADVLFVGRLVPPKNPLRFIRVVGALKKQKPDITAVMLGDGELAVECRKMIGKMGLEHTIYMAGFTRNPYPFMKQAKIMLVTSDLEGYGIAAAEAAVLGTPVLAANVGGLRSIFGDFPQALCGRPFSNKVGSKRIEADLRRKAAVLLRDPLRYELFKQEMEKRVYVEEIDRYMDRLESIYGELDR